MVINEKYKIESDALNVTLYYRQKPREGNNVENWRPLAYFSNPRLALEYLVLNEIMGDGFIDLETVCKKIDELNGLINTLKGLPELQRTA